MKLGEIEGAAGKNAALRRVLQAIETWGTGIEKGVGLNPLAPGHVGSRKLATPPLADFTVIGVDGHYVVDITNPLNVATMYHEVRAATTVPIVASNDIIVRGPFIDSHLDIIDPNTTRYFQLRSRFANSEYNAPQISQAVDSGTLRSISLSALQTRMTPYAATPLVVQNGATLGLIVSPFTMQVGGDTIAYAGGIIALDDVGDPLTFGTYYVYTLDPSKAGGAVTWLATDDPSRLTANDGTVTIPGSVTLRVDGGGVLFPPGLEGGPSVGTVIKLNSGATKLVEALVTGDILLGLDGPETVQAAPVAVTGVPAFTIVTISGKAVTIAGDHELQLGSGGRLFVADIVPGDSINTLDGIEAVTTKTFVGLITVYPIPLNKNHFHTGGEIWCG